MNEWDCAVCGEHNNAGASECARCGNPPPPAAAGPAQPAADPEPAESTEGRRCWNCQHEIPYHANRQCVSCGQEINPPPAVALRFPGRQVLVCHAGQSLALGRVGDQPSLFVPYPNVSRRHARLTVDSDGTPWLDPIPDAPNGTFVDGVEITGRHRLRDGQRVGFANRLVTDVVIPTGSSTQEEW